MGKQITYKQLEGMAEGESLTASGERLTLTWRGSVDGINCAVLENFGTGEEHLLFVTDDGCRRYRKRAALQKAKAADYLGYTSSEVLADGRDLLGEVLLAKSFSYQDLEGILPGDIEDSYFALGSYTSARCFTIDRRSCIWFQPDFQHSYPDKPVYDPAEEGALGEIQPEQAFLNSMLPVLCSVHRGTNETMETLCLTRQGDADFAYAVWIRVVIYSNSDRCVRSIYYRNIGACGGGQRLPLAADAFWDTFDSVVQYAERFQKEQAQLSIPEKTLESVYYSAPLLVDGLFNGFQARYGHRFYWLESHNNFPPNYITSILVYAMTGHKRKARGLVMHFLENTVDMRGRVIYLQGEAQLYGYSGSELGQLLWVILRYEKVLGSTGWIDDYADVLCAMGGQILRRIKPCQEVPGASLVHMCAEADTNGRVFDYLQNSLWAVRGLEPLAQFANRTGHNGTRFAAAAAELRRSVALVCEAKKVQTRCGELIPFQLQYTAVPWTLSNCKESFVPVDDAALEAYLAGNTNPREALEEEQNLLENTYANYRYYPEMLSSCLLEERYERAIVRLRETAGGECLGMTRLHERIDDWPAYNYAIYLIERGNIEKFRLLLYAHTRYHGLPEQGIYYEQVRFDGEKMLTGADSSVPCCLLTTLMLTQMFCYETVDGSVLELCKAVPPEWFGREVFSLREVWTSRGSVTIDATPETIRVTLDGDFNGQTIRLYLPENLLEAHDCSAQIEEKREHYFIMRPMSFQVSLTSVKERGMERSKVC